MITHPSPGLIYRPHASFRACFDVHRGHNTRTRAIVYHKHRYSGEGVSVYSRLFWTMYALVTRFSVGFWPGENEPIWDAFYGHLGNTTSAKFKTRSAKGRVSRDRVLCGRTYRETDENRNSS